MSKQDLASALMEAAVDAIIVIDNKGIIQQFSESAKALFGYAPEEKGLRFDPFLTGGLREALGDSNQAVLDGLVYKGAHLRVTLELPDIIPGTGHFPLQQVWVNGHPFDGAIPREAFLDLGTNEVVLRFGEFVPSEDSITRVNPQDPLSRHDPEVYAPECPQDSITEHNGQRFLQISDPVNDPANTRYFVFRDREFLGWMDSTGLWPEPIGEDVVSHHYGVVSEFRSSGHRSHQSRPLRVDGSGYQFIPVAVFSANEAARSDPEGYLEDWGAPGEELVFGEIKIREPGRYALRLRYFNDAHTIDSGVTCGVKQGRLEDASGDPLGTAVFQMPNVEVRDGDRRWQESTAWILELEPGTYRLVLSDYFNMSYLQSNATYQSKGGRDGPYNRIDLAGLCLIPLPEME